MGTKSIVASGNKVYVGNFQPDVYASVYPDNILLLDNSGIVGNLKVYEKLTVAKSISAANSNFKVEENGECFSYENNSCFRSFSRLRF